MQAALWHFFDVLRGFSILGGHWDVYCYPYETYVLMEGVIKILTIPPTRLFPFCHVYLHMLSVDTIEIYLHFRCFKCSLKRLWHLKTHSQVWDNFWQLKAPLKMMINAFYFISKALFVLKIFKSLSWLFGHVSKRLDYKDKVHSKFYDVTAWLTNNCNKHIIQYLENKKQRDHEIWSFNRI